MDESLKCVIFRSEHTFKLTHDTSFGNTANIVCQLISLSLQKLSSERPSSDGEGAVENGITTACNGKEQGTSQMQRCLV